MCISRMILVWNGFARNAEKPARFTITSRNADGGIWTRASTERFSTLRLQGATVRNMVLST